MQIPASYLINFQRIRHVEIPIIVESTNELQEIARLPYLTNYKILLAPSLGQGYTPEDYLIFMNHILDFVKTYASTGKHNLELRVSRSQDVNRGMFTSVTQTLRKQYPFEFRYQKGFLTVRAIDFKVVDSKRTLSPELVTILAQTQDLKGYLIKEPIFSEEINDPLVQIISNEIAYLPIKDFTLIITPQAGSIYYHSIVMLVTIPNLTELREYRYQDEPWTHWFARKPLYWSVTEIVSRVISRLNPNLQVQKPVRFTLPINLEIIPTLLRVFPNLEAVAVFDDQIPGTTTEGKIRELRSVLDRYPNLIFEVITQNPTLYQSLAQEYEGQLEPLQG